MKIFSLKFWKNLLKKPQPRPPKPEREVKEVKPKPREAQEVKEGSLVRSELNLERNNAFTVSTYREKSREVTIQIEIPEGTIERKVIIGKTAEGGETGVLTTNHFKLYLALLELWEKASRPITKPTHFTILKIIKRLGLVDSGGNYETMKKHLLSLRQVPLTFIDSFLTKEGNYTSLRPFSILSYLDIYERKYDTKRGKKTRGYGEFKFDDHLLLSLLDDHTHPLRLDVITQFKKHRDLAILLYCYLDRNLAFKPKYEVGLEKLFDHLDLSQKQITYPAKRKQKIEPVLEQLKGKSLSTGILTRCEVQKTKDGKDYKLVCRKRPTKQLEMPEKPITINIKDEEFTTLPLDELLERMKRSDT